MRKTIILLLVVFLIITVLIRFLNLAQTTRFTRDESSNLRDIHRIYVDKEITLIGPIDDTSTIIYPSLTFYMLLPFSYLGNFEPQSPAYGTAFYGVLSVIMLLLLTKHLNKKYFFLIAVLSLIWFPLVESARWAWNPHLVPFTSLVAIFLYVKEKSVYKFLSGLFFGLSFHLHYLTFASFLTFLLILGFRALNKRNLKTPILMGLGFFLMIIPFIYFDLKNPPGLFFGKFWQSNLLRSNSSTELTQFFTSFLSNVYKSVFYLNQTKIGTLLLGLITGLLLMTDIRKKRSSLMYFLPVVAQIAVISFLPTFENRYFLLGIVFFVVWLLYPREKNQEKLVSFAIVIMIFGSLLKIPGLLTKPIREPAAGTVSRVSNYVRDEVIKNDRKNINIAVLASPDPDPLGDVYRHTLQVKDINPLLENQYEITDNLFIVSTSEPDVIRKDPAHVMNGFRRGPITDTFSVQGTEWKVYLFNRD